MKKSQNVVLVLALLFGWLGAHRFYVGKIGTGMLYLFTFGLFGVGWAFDVLVAILKVVSTSTPSNEAVARKSSAREVSLPRPNSAVSNNLAPLEASFRRLLESNDFVAIDVEWADSRDSRSVCEIGIATFSDGMVSETYRQYVQPEEGFSVGMVEFRTHGIDRGLIEKAEPLSAQWANIEAFIGGRPWVLHNATQDVTRILSSLGAEARSGVSDFVFFDTMHMARKLPFITSSNGLTELADFLGVNRNWALYDGRDQAAKNPHGALEDAIVTGEILHGMIATVGYRTAAGLIELVGQTPGSVRLGEIVTGVSAPGKFGFSDLSAIPAEGTLLATKQQTEVKNAKIRDKRATDEAAKQEFLRNPSWSEMKVQTGMKVCFTQLMPWDENRDEGFDSEVTAIAAKMGLEDLGAVRKDLELLIVNDPFVSGSAKLRDALARGIPVTTYSIFQKNNPDFPVWNYKNAAHYRYLRAEGLAD
jgi:DNA polymerase III epsilon subunit-like protein